MNEEVHEQIRTVYRKHYKDVYSFLVYFTGNIDEAEDLTQEVFIRLLHSLSKFDGRSTLLSYILSIAKHVAIDHYRKKQLQLLYPSRWLKKIPTSEGLPEIEMAQKELRKDLKNALHKLKPQYRMVIILRGLKELSIKETADILGCSESKVKVDYHRALLMLEKKLKISTEGGYSNEWAK